MSKKNDDLGPFIESLILTFIFLCLSGLALAFREWPIVGGIVQGRIDPASEMGLCGGFPMCFRLTTLTIRAAIDNGLLFVAGALDLLPSRNYPQVLTMEAKHSFLVVYGGLVTRIFTLSPILFAVFVAYRRFSMRLLLMIIVFMSIFGWARSNPLFSEAHIQPYDYTAIGFVFLLYVLITHGYIQTFLQASVVLIIAQLTFEHLGMVTGVAVVLHEFMMRQDWQVRERTVSALRKLFGFGIVSIGVGALLYGALTWSLDSVYWVYPGKSIFYTYEFYGRTNLLEIYDLTENFIDLLAYPIIFGIILGLLSKYLYDAQGRGTSELRNEFWAALAIWIGFFCTLFIGIFTSGLHYEMGRQLLPLACITSLVCAKAVPVVVARVRGE